MSEPSSNILDDFVGAGFLEAHPELHHYTKFDGLTGIFESKTLRATHYSNLNDSSEIKLFREPLTTALASRLVELARRLKRESLRAARTIERAGGVEKMAREEAEKFIQILYRITFEQTETPPFADPYIASFCTHSSDEGYERENGLLSQWRGYGGEGGFCIVFDTKELIGLIRQELASHYWSYLNLDAVVYERDHQSLEQLFKDLIDVCEKTFSNIANGNEAHFEKGFGPFVTGATFFKHQGFKEEREVRIVVGPVTQKFIDMVHRENNFAPTLPLKKIYARTVDGIPIRYIHLFDTLKLQRLPIRRVIVGPSAEQEINYHRARAMLGGKVAIRRSETPYIGQNAI